MTQTNPIAFTIRTHIGSMGFTADMAQMQMGTRNLFAAVGDVSFRELTDIVAREALNALGGRSYSTPLFVGGLVALAINVKQIGDMMAQDGVDEVICFLQTTDDGYVMDFVATSAKRVLGKGIAELIVNSMGGEETTH